jgi:Zn-dependent M28 family amino/carboxypeptidase
MPTTSAAERRRGGRARVVGLLAAATVAVTSIIATPARAEVADPPPSVCERRVNDTVQALLACVTLAGVREHQAELQAIADQYGGTRAVGTKGFRASVDYVLDQLEEAGYTPEVQAFPFEQVTDLSDFQLTQPQQEDFDPYEDFLAAEFSPETTAQGELQAVDLVLPPTPEPSSTSGCEMSDFEGFEAGNIALIQRGTCTFALKAKNAQRAGAAGVVLFNEGQVGRTDVLAPSGTAERLTIPVIFTTFAIGERLAGTEGAVVRIAVDLLFETKTAWNVLAELQGTDDQVVMVGGHLDSVPEGPGINDNGSGSAAILETAIMMANVTPTHTVRFAWWGAEELGLVGSTYYVEHLPAEELARIALYMNYDMIGSPNYVRFVYDGDGDSFGTPGPDGSDEIEDVYHRWYDRQGLASEDTEFSGRSDYGPFIAAGIPAGGLFTGAEVPKTEEQEAIYGGEAGIPYDPCYHQACDDYDNVDLEVLRQNSDLVAFAALYWAQKADLPGGGDPTPTTLDGHRPTA